MRLIALLMVMLAAVAAIFGLSGGSRESRLLVGFKPGVSQAEQSKIISDAEAVDLGSVGSLRVHRVQTNDIDEKITIATLRSDEAVSFVEFDSQVESLRLPNDYYFPLQWSLRQYSDHDIDANSAWNERTSCSSVAILDTGIETSHSDLKSNLWINSGEMNNNNIDDDGNGYIDDYYGINMIKQRSNGNDDYGHGSEVAGLVGARGNNRQGVSGVCWRTSLMAVKFLDDKGVGTVSDAAESLDYATLNGAKIINASFATDTYSYTLRAAIVTAASRGSLVVAAAGNNGRNIDRLPLYPASYPDANLITVAASTSNDHLAHYSNYGPRSVDIAAPGSNILSTYLGGSFTYGDGTSLAAPLVTGASALLRADRSPRINQIKTALIKGADHKKAFEGKLVSGGRLNLHRALNYLRSHR